MTDREYVLKRYPGAFADDSGGTFVIRTPLEAGHVYGNKRISNHCRTPESAWKSAARRLGKPKEKTP